MKNNRSELIHEMVFNALLAALYVVFTIVVSPISYGAIQFRISELFVLFCFFNKKYVIGLTLGCLIANCFSPTAALDIPMGTAATLLACICVMCCKHLCVAILFPIVSNAFIVGLELWLFGEPFWFSVGFVALGEAVVMIISYIIMMILKNNKGFLKGIKADQNLDFKF